MKLVFSKKKWLRGNRDRFPSALLNSEGKMCCLGFLALACGADKKDILGVKTPSWASHVDWPESICVLTRNTNTTNNLMYENDRENITDDERQKRLTKLFKEANIDVEFVD